jgi:hypothetical protein
VIAVWHWFLYHFTGASNEGGWVYGLWSGIAGSLTVFAIFPITYATRPYRRNMPCCTPRCMNTSIREHRDRLNFY